jgi:predicted nucleotide-binding protein
METDIRWSYRPTIYIHAPSQPEPAQAQVKGGILNKIESMGFAPQEFHVSGMPKGDAWSFQRAIEVMRQCDGALILALMRRTEQGGAIGIPAPSEYSHFEGALALSSGLPSLVIAEQGMEMRGILASAGGSFVLQVPMQKATEWLSTDSLAREPAFQRWVERVEARHDVFFGYCSKANKVARNIKSFLTDEAGMRVLDWATDFRPGHTIMEEIARATATCRCGLFLFTTDDPIGGSSTATAIPRDNVLLEAGYFMSAHTAKRMVVVRETGTKMPADVGGMIYLTLNRRNEWKAVANQIVTAFRKQLSDDIYG